MKRPHPYTALVTALGLLPFALIGGAGRLLGGRAQLSGTLDYLLMLLFLSAVLCEYIACEYKDGGRLTVKTGIFFKRTSLIFSRRLCFTYFKRSPLQRILSCTEVKSVQKSRGEDKRGLQLEDADAALHLNALYGADFKAFYKMNLSSAVLASLAQSDVLNGLLLISIAVSRLGKLLGEKYTALIGQALDLSPEIGRILKIEPIFALIGFLLLAGYISSCLVLLFGYCRFKAEENGRSIKISRSFVYRNELCFLKASVSSLSLREGFFMRLLRRAGVYFTLSGEVRRSGGRSVLIPYAPRDFCKSFIEKTLNQSEACVKRLAPPKRAAMAYIGVQLWIVVGALLAAILLRFFNIGGKIIYTLLFLTAVGAGIWGLFRLLGLKRVSVSFYKDACVVKRISGLSYITDYIRICEITELKIKQSPFQRMGDSFDLIFILSGHKIKIRHLAKD